MRMHSARTPPSSLLALADVSSCNRRRVSPCISNCCEIGYRQWEWTQEGGRSLFQNHSNRTSPLAISRWQCRHFERPVTAILPTPKPRCLAKNEEISLPLLNSCANTSLASSAAWTSSWTDLACSIPRATAVERGTTSPSKSWISSLFAVSVSEQTAPPDASLSVLVSSKLEPAASRLSSSLLFFGFCLGAWFELGADLFLLAVWLVKPNGNLTPGFLTWPRLLTVLRVNFAFTSSAITINFSSFCRTRLYDQCSNVSSLKVLDVALRNVAKRRCVVSKAKFPAASFWKEMQSSSTLACITVCKYGLFSTIPKKK